MKKIGIYLERRPDSGGAYQYCLAMLDALSLFPKTEYKIIAFCTYPEWKQLTELMGIETYVVQKNFVQKVIHYIAERTISVELYRKNCRRIHPLAKKIEELSIEACIYPCGDKISFMIDTPSIITIFDLMHRYLKEFPEIVDKKVYRSRERSYHNIAKYAQMILVDSEVGKRQMVECYGKAGRLDAVLEGKIQVLPMIAPDYVYKCDGNEAFPKFQRFNKYIFYPAQFWKHKNHKNLLLSIAILKKKNIIVNLVFCGSGKNAFEEIMQNIQENELEKQVQILGYISNEEMVYLYQHARALIMPTFGGPTNIPQLEAFVLGCPVATSNIFGIPEQVGDAALLFDPGNVEEIADCVERLWMCDELCEKLVQNGYERNRRWNQETYKLRLQELL